MASENHGKLWKKKYAVSIEPVEFTQDGYYLPAVGLLGERAGGSTTGTDEDPEELSFLQDAVKIDDARHITTEGLLNYMSLKTGWPLVFDVLVAFAREEDA